TLVCLASYLRFCCTTLVCLASCLRFCRTTLVCLASYLELSPFRLVSSQFFRFPLGLLRCLL
ncbi:hypothetical protein BS47DRAFT_1348338, partial [Hydnum rufescens UP504]